MGVGHSGTVIVSMRQCGTSDREHVTVLDSDSGCGMVLDSASQHGMYSISAIINYNLW